MKKKQKEINYDKHIDEDFFYKKIAKGKSGIVSYYGTKGRMKVEYVWHTPRIVVIYYNIILSIKYLIRKMKGEV